MIGSVAGRRSPDLAFAGPMLTGALAATAYFVPAHLEFGDGWPLAAAAVACSLASAPLAGALCLAASALQDARGMEPQPALATVLGCGGACLLRGGWSLLATSPRTLRLSLAACAMAVFVGLAVSVAGLFGAGFEQSDVRPPIGVAVADLAMPTVGASVGLVATASVVGRRMLAGAVLAALALIAARVGAQAWLAPDAGFSEVGRESIAAARQLSGDASSGQVRFIGSMLTPNAMSVSVVLLLLAGFTAVPPRSFPVALLAGATMAAAAWLAGSKSSLVVAAAAAAALAFAASWRKSMAMLACGAAALVVLSDGGIGWDAIESRMRIDVVGVDTIRSRAWQACAAELRPVDALLGMGLSHWPVFFERTIGDRMADPHSAVFSYPWTYGIAGPAALALTSWCLARIAFRGGPARAAALALLALLLVRDMVAIPLLIGTTVLTLQLWACIAMLLARDTR